MSEFNNFAVVDIGTNAVKCKIYANGRYITPKNKMLRYSSANSLNEDEVSSLVGEFADLVEKYGVTKEKLYICATEALRQTPNRESIKKRIFEEIGRKIHVISPKREAYLSVIGGLRTIPEHGDRSKDVVSSAKNVLYIESGGGSTEVSLVNLASKPPAIISTVSLPLGSKKYGNDEHIFDEKIADFTQQILDAKYHIKEPLICVINSNSISRVISHQYKLEKFDAYTTMAKQQKMSFRNLQVKLHGILTDAENKPKIMQEYGVSEDRAEGFVGHCHIISNILKKLHNQKLGATLNSVPVLTTVGGLKEGLADEIIRSDLKDVSDIEEALLLISEGDKAKKDASSQEQKPTNPQAKIHELKERMNQEKGRVGELDGFYKTSEHGYKVTKNNSLMAEDKHKQKLIFKTNIR